MRARWWALGIILAGLLSLLACRLGGLGWGASISAALGSAFNAALVCGYLDLRVRFETHATRELGEAHR